LLLPAALALLVALLAAVIRPHDRGARVRTECSPAPHRASGRSRGPRT
jgi:hypothetical protein